MHFVFIFFPFAIDGRFSSLPEHNTVETFINHTFGKLQTRHVCTPQTTSLKFFTGQTTF